MLKVRDGRYATGVKVLRPDVELTVEKSPLDTFRERWLKLEDRVQLPHVPWQAEDYGIAARLIHRHGAEQLTSLLERFFWYHSDPLREDYRHPLRLFAASLPKLMDGDGS